MLPELQKLIALERKHKRELQELRDLRARIMTQKEPNKQLITLIDGDIKTYLDLK